MQCPGVGEAGRDGRAGEPGLGHRSLPDLDFPACQEAPQMIHHPCPAVGCGFPAVMMPENHAIHPVAPQNRPACDLARAEVRPLQGTDGITLVEGRVGSWLRKQPGINSLFPVLFPSGLSHLPSMFAGIHLNSVTHACHPWQGCSNYLFARNKCLPQTDTLQTTGLSKDLASRIQIRSRRSVQNWRRRDR